MLKIYDALCRVENRNLYLWEKKEAWDWQIFIVELAIWLVLRIKDQGEKTQQQEASSLEVSHAVILSPWVTFLIRKVLTLGLSLAARS